jgi:hypothetical protein
VDVVEGVVAAAGRDGGAGDGECCGRSGDPAEVLAVHGVLLVGWLAVHNRR